MAWALPAMAIPAFRYNKKCPENNRDIFYFLFNLG